MKTRTHRTVTWLTAAAVGAVPAVIPGSPAAAASDGVAKVSITGKLTYEAAGTVRNVIRVSTAAGAFLVDDIVPITAGTGCRHHTTDRTIVQCTGSISMLGIYGYGGDDEIIISASTSWTEAWGGAGQDVLWGGVGKDRLFGDAGTDTIDGGPGNDTTDGGEGDDFLYGDTGDDHMNGGAGADWMEGQEGADFVSGEKGDDTMLGGSNDDALVGGPGFDYLSGGTHDSSWGDTCKEGEQLVGCEH